MKNSEVLNFVDPKDVISLTQKLISIPSESPAKGYGDRSPLLTFIDDQFKSMGLATKRITIVEDRPNIVVEIMGQGKGPTLMLYSHADTIEVTDEHREKWNTDPFEGVIKDDRLYGLGSSDAKSGVAAVIAAVKAIVASGISFHGKIIVLFTTAAEGGSPGGSKTLIEHNLMPMADGVITADAADQKIVRTFKGRIWIEFIVHGKSVHACEPEGGINAIDKMYDVIQGLKKIEFIDHDDPDLGGITFVVSSIDGRNIINSVPRKCRITVDMGLIPGVTSTLALKKIQDTLDNLMHSDKDLNVVMNVLPNSIKEVAITPLEHPVVQATAKAMEKVAGKTEYLPGIMSSGGERFLKAGIPAIVFGPGSILNAHKPNEYVEVYRLEEAAKIYALAALEFLGASD